MNRSSLFSWYREPRIQRRSPLFLFLIPIDPIEEGAATPRQDVIRDFRPQGLKVYGKPPHFVADHQPSIDASDQSLQEDVFPGFFCKGGNRKLAGAAQTLQERPLGADLAPGDRIMEEGDRRGDTA